MCLEGSEISLGKFVSEDFTPLTLDSQTGVVSTEDTGEIWKTAKEEAMEKVKGRANRTEGRIRPWSMKWRWKSLSGSAGQTAR